MLRPTLFLVALLLAGCDKTPGTPDAPPEGTVTIPVHFQTGFARDYVAVEFGGETVSESSMTTLAATGLADVVPLFADEDGGDQFVEVRVDTLGADDSIFGAVRFDPAEDAAVVVRFARYDSASDTPASLSLTPVATVPTYD